MVLSAHSMAPTQKKYELLQMREEAARLTRLADVQPIALQLSKNTSVKPRPGMQVLFNDTFEAI